MANLQVKNVPDALHRKLRRQARKEGRTIRDFVLAAVRREVEEREFWERLDRRQPVDPGRPAADVLAEARAAREEELGH